MKFPFYRACKSPDAEEAGWEVQAGRRFCPRSCSLGKCAVNSRCPYAIVQNNIWSSAVLVLVSASSFCHWDGGVPFHRALVHGYRLVCCYCQALILCRINSSWDFQGGKNIRREKFSAPSTSMLFKERKPANSFGFLYIRLQLQLTKHLQHPAVAAVSLSLLLRGGHCNTSQIRVELPYSLLVYRTCIGSVHRRFQNSPSWIFLSCWRLLHLGFLRRDVPAPT